MLFSYCLIGAVTTGTSTSTSTLLELQLALLGDIIRWHCWHNQVVLV
jgi:hypothetical protein